MFNSYIPSSTGGIAPQRETTAEWDAYWRDTHVPKGWAGSAMPFEGTVYKDQLPPSAPSTGAAGGNPWSALRQFGGAQQAGGNASQAVPAPSQATANQVNPYDTISNIKNPDIQAQINRALSGFSKRASDYNNRYDEFLNKFSQAADTQQKIATQEGEAVGDYFDGEMQARLDKILGGYKSAIGDLTGRLESSVYRNDDLYGMQNEGGMSSYRDRLIADQIAKINERSAEAVANREYDQLQWLEGQKQNLLGQRGEQQQALTQFEMLPEQYRGAMDQQLLNYLSGVTNLDQANTFYGVQRPYEPDYGNTLDMLRELGLTDEQPMYS